MHLNFVIFVGSSSRLKKKIEERWLTDLRDDLALFMRSRFSNGSTSIRVSGQDGQKVSYPVVSVLDERYELLKRLGYIDKVPTASLAREDVSCPEQVLDGKSFPMDVPYLNVRARRMYESLRREGFFERHC